MNEYVYIRNIKISCMNSVRSSNAGVLSSGHWGKQRTYIIRYLSFLVWIKHHVHEEDCLLFSFYIYILVLSIYFSPPPSICYTCSDGGTTLNKAFTRTWILMMMMMTMKMMTMMMICFRKMKEQRTYVSFISSHNQ